MPFRKIVSEELSGFYEALSHPVRIRILFELKSSPKDVASLASALCLNRSTLSQHLGVLKSLAILSSERDGHHQIYSLSEPAICDWILESLEFLRKASEQKGALVSSLENAKEVWN